MPDYQETLILANRDEFYHRPTEPAHFWKKAPHILAGKDLLKGGTWLGVTLDGRFGALANIRNPQKERLETSGMPSRGQLVADFLYPKSYQKNKISFLWDYLEKIETKKQDFEPFHLILGYLDGPLYYISSFQGAKQLETGVFVISNTVLEEPLPKVKKLENWLKENQTPTLQECLEILGNKELPMDTIVQNKDLQERTLSPIFVSSPFYGTRASTVIQIHGQEKLFFLEKVFGPNGKEEGWQEFSFAYCS